MGIDGFEIVFGDIKFDAGGIESGHRGEGGADRLADGFGIIHHLLEHECNEICETELKA